MKILRKYQTMKFDSLDAVLQSTEELISVAGEKKDDHYELPSPIMFELTNPVARFSCAAENRDWVAKSAAETLYAFSGMNGSDFIWEFRNWEDPRVKQRHDPAAVGTSLRFRDQKEFDILGYYGSNSLRQKGAGFVDQIAESVAILKRDRNARNVTLQISTQKNLIPVYQSWLYCQDDKLNIMTWAGYLDNRSELVFKYIPIFSFLLEIISDLTGIAMGNVQFIVGCLCTDKLRPPRIIRSIGYPIVNTSNFKYPSGGLGLRDLDVLMSIMIEFVSRLDENSLGRANPFEGDARIQMWSDYAEIFRAWKAEKLGYKTMMEHNFYHPQLRFIYKGEAS
jgi:hypothetical protein